MEIGLANAIPTYSGGLGVLTGDTLRTAADMSLPMVAVTLVYRAGYFRQETDADGNQVEHPGPWDPSLHAARLNAAVALARQVERGSCHANGATVKPSFRARPGIRMP